MALPKCPCCGRTLRSLLGHNFRFFPWEKVSWWRLEPAPRFCCASCGTELMRATTLAGRWLGLVGLGGAALMLAGTLGRFDERYGGLVVGAGLAIAIASNLAAAVWGDKYVARQEPARADPARTP